MSKPEPCCGDGGGVEEGAFLGTHLVENLFCPQQLISVSLMTKMCCLYYFIVEKLDESTIQTPNSSSVGHPGN